METAPNILDIAVSRYQAKDKIVPSGRVPLGFTLGHPRFKLGYTLAANIRELGPDASFKDEPSLEVFERLYRAKLDRIGLPQVLMLIAKGAHNSVNPLDKEQLSARGAVLLCYEADPAECHRSMFARWWTEQTGQDCKEL